MKHLPNALYAHGIIYSIDENITSSELRLEQNSWDTASSETFLNSKKNADELQRWIVDNHVHVLVDGMDSFHFKLNTVCSAPYIVYAIGNLDLLNQSLLAIVGPRMKTKYADNVLEKLFLHLPLYNLVTISGLAEGVDRLCHRLSIEAGIPTIAVLGCGLRRYMRSSESAMLRSIVDNGGLVLSEFPLDMKSSVWSYPQRNRIVAGMSECVFLPEAAEKSGSLITVNFANKMQIPVYGTPHHIFQLSSKGLNTYISKGKINLVTNLEDFVSKHFDRSQNQDMIEKLDLSKIQIQIVTCLKENGPSTIGMIKGKLNINSQDLISELGILEITGVLEETQTGIFCLK